MTQCHESECNVPLPKLFVIAIIGSEKSKQLFAQKKQKPPMPPKITKIESGDQFCVVYFEIESNKNSPVESVIIQDENQEILSYIKQKNTIQNKTKLVCCHFFLFFHIFCEILSGCVSSIPRKLIHPPLPEFFQNIKQNKKKVANAQSPQIIPELKNGNKYRFFGISINDSGFSEKSALSDVIMPMDLSKGVTIDTLRQALEQLDTVEVKIKFKMFF